MGAVRLDLANTGTFAAKVDVLSGRFASEKAAPGQFAHLRGEGR
jgi:hypothetical protein